VNLYHK